MKKRLTILSFVTAWMIPWSSTNASFVLKDFVCEADKSLSCFSVSNTGNDIEDMQRDLEVCNCLEDKFDIKIKDSLTPAEIKERDQKIYEGKMLASLVELKKNFEKKAEPYLLESLLINPENPTEAVKQVFDTMGTNELANNVKKDLERYRNKVSPQFFEGVLAQVDHYTKTEAGNLVKKIKESKDKLQERGYCLSYEGFLTSKMIPESPLFWQELGSDKEFNPNDWNAEILHAEMKMGKNVDLNLAKLNFLEMNPTVKATFKGQNSALQRALFTLLKKELIQDSSCIRKNDCQGRFLSSRKNLPNMLKEFYGKGIVRADISAHLYLEMNEERTLLNRLDDKQPTLSALRLASDNKTISYKECGGGIDPQKTGQCAEILQNYCTDLRTSGDSILQIQNGEMVNNNRFRLDDDIFSEPDQNSGYFKMNDLACNVMKRIDRNTKKEMTYKQFKSEECNKNNCSNITDVELFKKFMNSTKSTNDGIIFDTRTNEERLFESIANSSNIKLDNKILSIASRDNSSLSDRSKSSENMSIYDVIANIEKTNSASSSESSTTISQGEGSFSTSEIFSDAGSLDGSLPGQDISLQNLGTFGNQAYLNAPNQFLAKVEEENDKKETETSKEGSSVISSTDSSIKETDLAKDKDLSLEERIKGLEKLLAEKDSSTKSYQKMITQLLEQKNSAQASHVARTSTAQESLDIPADKKTVVAKSTVQNLPKLSKEQLNSHTNDTSERMNAPQENFANREGGRAPASLGSSSAGQSFASNSSRRVNNALLTKYGIVVKDGPSGSTSAVSVAEEADGSKFSGVKSIAEAADVPLQVSVRDFEQIKTNNLGALEALYTKGLKGIDDQVVKVLVSTNSREEVLEFYAIKEQGRVVFQPIRKNKLIDLQNVLHR